MLSRTQSGVVGKVEQSKPSILFHRGISWNQPVRGSTSIYAKHFASIGYPTTWMSRIRHLVHLLGRAEGGIGSTYRRHDDGVLEISPFSLVPHLKIGKLGADFWKLSAQLSYENIVPSLHSLFEDAEQPFPEIIWTTGGDGGVLKRAFPEAKQIVQCVDLYEAYAGNAQNKLEIEDYRSADSVVSIGHALAEFLVEKRGVPGEKIEVIGQGADLSLFERTFKEPDGLKGLPRPIMIWVGVLEKCDSELFQACLSALPAGEGSLVMIGPWADWVQEIVGDPRVHVLGPKTPDESAAYLKHSDIGLMLYDRKRPRLQYLGQNPLKLYEMAAAGLPIVSTPHDEYRFLSPPVIEVSCVEEIKPAITNVIENSDPMRLSSLEFASKHSWQSRFADADNLIHRLLLE